MKTAAAVTKTYRREKKKLQSQLAKLSKKYQADLKRIRDRRDHLKLKEFNQVDWEIPVFAGSRAELLNSLAEVILPKCPPYKGGDTRRTIISRVHQMVNNNSFITVADLLQGYRPAGDYRNYGEKSATLFHMCLRMNGLRVGMEIDESVIDMRVHQPLVEFLKQYVSAPIRDELIAAFRNKEHHKTLEYSMGHILTWDGIQEYLGLTDKQYRALKDAVRKIDRVLKD